MWICIHPDNQMAPLALYNVPSLAAQARRALLVKYEKRDTAAYRAALDTRALRLLQRIVRPLSTRAYQQ